MSARQKSIINVRVSNGTIFPNIAVLISTSMDTLVEKTEEKLRRRVTGVLELIKNDIEMARTAQEEGNGHGGDDEELDRANIVQMIEDLKLEHNSMLEKLVGC